jgi:uncharacterized protein YgbK (DUF1537 family)
MIVVVADDFTGAAELAGIGLSHGLSVELDMEGVEPATEADLLVIATDTRSKPLEEAIPEVGNLAVKLKEYRPDLIYKKIDSVLRGHILEEIDTLVTALGLKGAILVPANPALGRVIIDGIYYVNGDPLQHTSFSEDPEFEISTSAVAGLLARNGSNPPFEIIKPEDFTGEGTIVVGEASSCEDLDFWAGKAVEGWLPVGAAGFFQSLLLNKGIPVVNGTHSKEAMVGGRTLYLCGSTFQGSREQVTLANSAGSHVCYMPSDLFWQRENYEVSLKEWIRNVVFTLEKYNKAVVAVSEPVTLAPVKSGWIRNSFARLVKGVLGSTSIDELVIEGGSTASAVLGSIGLTRLKPFHQFQQGVIRMKIENMPGMYLTMKPGSYTWPETVWKF